MSVALLVTVLSSAPHRAVFLVPLDREALLPHKLVALRGRGCIHKALCRACRRCTARRLETCTGLHTLLSGRVSNERMARREQDESGHHDRQPASPEAPCLLSAMSAEVSLRFTGNLPSCGCRGKWVRSLRV